MTEKELRELYEYMTDIHAFISGDEVRQLIEKIWQLEAALRDILVIAFDDDELNWVNKINDIARAALDKEI